MQTSSGTAYAVGQYGMRPWGEWRVIDLGPGFVVKRITVRPGQRLSLQRHRHREEHWLVVSGAADATRGADVVRLEVGGTMQIRCGQTHRVANPGTLDLVLVEVQLGAELSEDDIERLEDAYGRVPPG